MRVTMKRIKKTGPGQFEEIGGIVSPVVSTVYTEASTVLLKLVNAPDASHSFPTETEKIARRGTFVLFPCETSAQAEKVAEIICEQGRGGDLDHVKKHVDEEGEVDRPERSGPSPGLFQVVTSGQPN